MNKHAIVIATLVAGAGLMFGTAGQAMVLSSTSMANGASLSPDQVKSDCGGKNVSPELSWSGAPPAAKSFAITMFDPDAHGGWWHWVVIDIPSSSQSLAAGAGNGSSLPKGAMQLKNDFGYASYGGACPPPGSGPHHYETTLWALPVESLPFGADAKPGEIGAYLKAHAIAHAQISGIYER